jgi:hypothetical protein
MRHRERGTRNSQPGQDPSDPDQVLEALLAGCPLPDEAPAGLQPVADVLTALRQPAVPAELTGQASALAQFRARPRRTAAATWPRRRGGPVRGPLLRPRPATALLAGAVVVAGLAAGAYEGDLPGPVQQWAHHTFGLTAARSKAPRPPEHRKYPGHTATASPSPAPSPHHRQGTAQAGLSQHGGQHGDSHRAADRDGHQHGDQPGNPDPSSPSSPSRSPSPSAPATPEPSTSPAAQPSAQSSTAPGPHDPRSSPSSPP